MKRAGDNRGSVCWWSGKCAILRRAKLRWIEQQPLTCHEGNQVIFLNCHWIGGGGRSRSHHMDREAAAHEKVVLFFVGRARKRDGCSAAFEVADASFQYNLANELPIIATHNYVFRSRLHHTAEFACRKNWISPAATQLFLPYYACVSLPCIISFWIYMILWKNVKTNQRAHICWKYLLFLYVFFILPFF